jgi:hypothetical protein
MERWAGRRLGVHVFFLWGVSLSASYSGGVGGGSHDFRLLVHLMSFCSCVHLIFQVYLGLVASVLTDTYGWRVAFRVLSGVTLVTIGGAGLFFRVPGGHRALTDLKRFFAFENDLYGDGDDGQQEEQHEQEVGGGEWDPEKNHLENPSSSGSVSSSPLSVGAGASNMVVASPPSSGSNHSSLSSPPQKRGKRRRGSSIFDSRGSIGLSVASRRRRAKGKLQVNELTSLSEEI